MIKRSLATVFTAVSIFICVSSSAQRLSDRNTIGWFGTFNTVYLNKNLSLWLEYQWRRENIIIDWQQLFARGGLQYHITNEISVMAGYVYALTYPYGDFPPGPHPVPEHRIFEQLTWNDEAGRIGINHRLRLEQRYQGNVDQAHHDYHVSGWNYMNRVRYQLRGTVPLNNKKMAARTLYTALFDEIFIGFGKNVKQNIFDQNRLGLVIGYQLDKHFRAEGGVINVIQQQGALVQQKNVFQYNTGVIINCYLTLRNQ
jgi:hypothetical protein